MTSLLRKLSRLLWPMTALIAIALPTIAALLMAHWVSMQRMEERGMQMASLVLSRADRISTEMRHASRAARPPAGESPCGPANLQRMRKALLESATLMDMGYIRDDRLLCSVLGEPPLSVGKPVYVSAAGYQTRTAVHYAIAPGATLLATTDPATGISMFTQPSQILDGIPDREPWTIAVVGRSSPAQVLAGRGHFQRDWQQRLGTRRAGLFLDGSTIVAWEHSQRGAYTVFVAMPSAIWKPVSRRNTQLALTLGVPTSLLMMLVLWRMAQRSSSMRSLLKRALKRGELSLAYQPIVELATGRWIGAEVLLRWHRPRGETISPDIFIPIAEKSGLMPALGDYLIHRIERETPALFAQHPDFHIALNFCAEDLCDERFPSRLNTSIQRIGATPHNVQIEVTERVFMHLERASPTITTLQRLGVAVAIDDFGTGFSSLSYLTRLQFNLLKIDKSFVSTLETAALTSKIVDHIIAMSKSLNISMIAEGVETQAQADYLRAQGVQFAQGWLYAKAMPMRELLARLRTSDSGQRSPAGAAHPKSGSA